MNAASQLLRVLAILGAIAAGVLFYMTNGKNAALTSQVGKANSALSSAKADSDKTIQDLQTQVTAAAADKDKMQKDLKAALDQADLADKRFAAAKDSLDSTDATIKDKDTKIADFGAQIADLSQKVSGMDAVTARLANDESIIASQAKRITDFEQDAGKTPAKGTAPGTPASAKTAATSGDVAPVAPAQLSAAASAKIVQIDTKNWLLVLDVGTDSGVQKDSQLYLKVGDQPIGVVVVRSTDAKTSTCAIASTEPFSAKDFAKNITAGLKVDYQRAL